LGGGGKAKNLGWAIYGTCLGGKLGNNGIMVLGCIFLEDTKVCSKFFAI